MKSYLYFLFLLLPFSSLAQFINSFNNDQKAGVNINYTESRGSLLEVYYSKQLSQKNSGRISVVSDFSNALHLKLGWRISLIRIKNLILGSGLDIRYYTTLIQNKVEDGIMLDLPLYIDYNLSEQFVINFDFNYPILQLSKRKKYRISEHKIMNFGVGYRF